MTHVILFTIGTDNRQTRMMEGEYEALRGFLTQKRQLFEEKKDLFTGLWNGKNITYQIVLNQQETN